MPEVYDHRRTSERRAITRAMNCGNPEKVPASRSIPNLNRAHQRSGRYRDSPHLQGGVEGSSPFVSTFVSTRLFPRLRRMLPAGLVRSGARVAAAADLVPGEDNQGRAREEEENDEGDRVPVVLRRPWDRHLLGRWRAERRGLVERLTRGPRRRPRDRVPGRRGPSHRLGLGAGIRDGCRRVTGLRMRDGGWSGSRLGHRRSPGHVLGRRCPVTGGGRRRIS